MDKRVLIVDEGQHDLCKQQCGNRRCDTTKIPTKPQSILYIPVLFGDKKGFVTRTVVSHKCVVVVDEGQCVLCSVDINVLTFVVSPSHTTS